MTQRCRFRKKVAPSSSPESSQSIENPTKAPAAGNTDLEVLDYVEEEGEGEQERVGIADPLEPFNRAMYHFNDKVYFWVSSPWPRAIARSYPK